MQLCKPTFEIDLSIAFGKMITAGKYFNCIKFFFIRWWECDFQNGDGKINNYKDSSVNDSDLNFISYDNNCYLYITCNVISD